MNIEDPVGHHKEEKAAKPTMKPEANSTENSAVNSMSRNKIEFCLVKEDPAGCQKEKSTAKSTVRQNQTQW